jgi:hypothetical protein
MASYRIVCTVQVPVTQPWSHRHIVEVGTGSNPDGYSKKWTLTQVLAAIDRGETFYTEGKQSGKRARVVKVQCDSCGRDIIRSSPDAVADNNLDNLRACRT